KVNARLPCPADGTYAKDVSASFGQEAANPGSCVGGTIAADFDDGSDTVGGVIPVRTLAPFGLQDDDLYDPYGNALSYFASKKITAAGAMRTYPPTNTVGSITVYDATNTTPRTSTAI